MIDNVARARQPFGLRPSMILDLHRCALEGLSAYTGNFQPAPVASSESKHIPHDAFLVVELIEDMCVYGMIYGDYGSYILFAFLIKSLIY